MAEKIEELTQQVPGLDLWQPRDWPHRRGDKVSIDLLSFPLPESSPGNRSHPCDKCGRDCLCIHDNVLCWNCKGAFCLTCFMSDPTPLMFMSQDKIVNEGWGDCPVCETRLRSIALIDVFRVKVDQNLLHSSSTNMTHSLLAEAEWALALADKLGRKARKGNASKKEKAICSYTHAINAINYLASSSRGTQLILRAQDILLIAHASRAELEDNQDLCEAILAKFPTQSVRMDKIAKGKPRSDFKTVNACYYTLPAKFMAPAEGGVLCVDTRNQCKATALQDPNLLEQVRSIGREQQFEQWRSSMGGMIPSPSSNKSEALLCTNKGMQFFFSLGFPPNMCSLGNVQFAIMHMIQFMWTFQTKEAASEYYRVSDFSDNCPGMELLPFEEAQQSLRDTFGVKHISVTLNQQSAAGMPDNANFSIVALLGHHVTKIFVSAIIPNGSSIKEIVLTIATKVLGHLKATDKKKECAGFDRVHDSTLCSWCGKENADLRRCQKCCNAFYCGRDCQIAHWTMKGPFGHKVICSSSSAKEEEEITEASFNIGDHVTIGGLRGSKHLNGKRGVVLSERLTNNRREVVLMDDLSVQELSRIVQAKEYSWVQDTSKKSFKESNLTHSDTAVLPCINLPRSE